MMEVVNEDVGDDQFDTTAATRTSSSATAPARISLHPRLMPLTAHLGQKIRAGAIPRGGCCRGKGWGGMAAPGRRAPPSPTTAGKVPCGSGMALELGR